MKDYTLAKLLMNGFGLFWIFGLLLSIISSGLVTYIIYRVATHPW